MNKQIRRSKFTKVMACYLAMMILLQITAPMQAYALTEGPSQPEFNSFTPIGTSDMVDLASGDFNYNIPIMDVGGYPINLAYNSGVTMDQEASWVGLGWNLNVGQINRNVRGLPDDFKGDVVETENNLKTNVTVGVNPYFNVQVIGLLDNPNMGLSVGAGLDVQHNNYVGFKATPSFGASFKFSSFVSAGMQLSSSVEDGVSVTPSVSLSATASGIGKNDSFGINISPSITYNSRQGLQSFNISSGIGYMNEEMTKRTSLANVSASGSGTISYLNNTFTPTKRLAFKNTNVRFSFSGGVDIWGVHGELTTAGYGSIQKLVDTKVSQDGYGYENTDLANSSSLLDFNREKEQGTVTKGTLVLPVTNYTHDLYTIQGQGIGGMFRPFRGQVGYVYDSKVVDQSTSNSFAFEFEAGAGGHVGGNFRNSTTSSYTGNWETADALPFFKERIRGNKLGYEKVYYMNVGENHGDEPKGSQFLPALSNASPIALKLDMDKNATNAYRTKLLIGTESVLTDGVGFNTNNIKREKRQLRNQMIQKITKKEAKRYGLPFVKYNSTTVPIVGSDAHIPLVPDHHNAGYIVTDVNGSRHIYGETIYNKEKKEVSFNIGNPGGNNLDLNSGQARYGSQDNKSSNSSGRDHFFNSIRTPAYAHTYLLTSVLSSDYEDVSNDGPSDDDLGTYTKFIYKDQGDYKWRVPYGKMKNSASQGVVSQNVASYNEGLKTDNLDQKGSYIYGIKENKYLRRIETKTHIAFFDLEKREDGVGVTDENGGGSAPNLISPHQTKNMMFRIKSIRLYSKPEAKRANLLDNNSLNDKPIKPIKTAHFEYDYSLCQGIDNNFRTVVGDQGKLTLKKVYFTYGSSNMGKFTPYNFGYKGADILEDYNPNYNIKGYDIWGNYKEFITGSAHIDSPNTTPQEFPYVDQQFGGKQDVHAAAWTLHTVDLPSGGKIVVEYEADDYKYVQDKRAMQMFKVLGVTNSITSPVISNSLYGGTGSDKKFIAIKVDPRFSGETSEKIRKRYTEGLKDKPIYFNFLVNMTPDSYDYVSGYFEMEGDATVSVVGNEKVILIPMRFLDLEGRSNNGTADSNPISVAGWFFGRQNLNGKVFGGSMTDPGGSVASNIVDIGKSIVGNLSELINIFNGANKVLKGKGCAKNFKPSKSWIRLNEPTGSKIGGGSRVKNIVLKDQWDKMLNISQTLPTAILDRYAKQYGQKYEYNLDDAEGTSSGVATYEPNMCKENPLIQPFYHKKERLTEQTYQERPFGESFFPAPTVTYSRVTVSNINASSTPTTTGKVVTHHYTSFDFPTKTDFTNLDKSKSFNSNEDEAINNMLKGLLSMKVNTQVDLTMTQGFVVETNDMNGKLKKQEVFNNSNAMISSVEYKYATQEADPILSKVKDERILDNMLPVVRDDGTIAKVEIGTQYDVVNDFRESYSEVNSTGVAANVDFIPLGFLPIIIGWASVERAEHKQILRTAVTTKVVHRTGILKEKVAYDLGSIAYTKNLAWDAKTGQVVLTETGNEFDDKYYSFNFPAYWNYKRMGMASENADMQGSFNDNPSIEETPNVYYFKMDGVEDITQYLKPGDELLMYQIHRRVWVAGYNEDKDGVRLIKADGQPVTSLVPNTPITVPGAGMLFSTNFRIIRSANRNNQMASMASITMMRNPITTDGLSSDNYKDNINTTFTVNSKIINASAVEYEDFWEAQCENGLRLSTSGRTNPYLYNIRGDWRAVRSYAYLTGRSTSTNSTIRNTGYFTSFNPFYKSSNFKWTLDSSNWTYASEVTKYNPFGVEVENKDALNRYSSAQYGYKYTLPVAVASNSQYKEMGFEGFEDYDFTNWINPLNVRPHFGFNESINQNIGVTITGTTSHSGKKSIAVGSNAPAVLIREIDPCESNN